jgi:hypothetical protein
VIPTMMSVGEYEYARLGQWASEPDRVRPIYGVWRSTRIACPACNRAVEGKAIAKPLCWPPRAFLRCKSCDWERDSVA